MEENKKTLFISDEVSEELVEGMSDEERAIISDESQRSWKLIGKGKLPLHISTKLVALSKKDLVENCVRMNDGDDTADYFIHKTTGAVYSGVKKGGKNFFLADEYKSLEELREFKSFSNDFLEMLFGDKLKDAIRTEPIDLTDETDK